MSDGKRNFSAILIGGLIGLVAAMFFGERAHAQTPAEEYCTDLAHYAEAVAKDRDEGTPMYLAIELAGQYSNPAARSDLLWIVQYVHDRDSQTPEAAASHIFEYCWTVYGE